ncbi:MAG TPA: hypothetical protein VE359_15930 [Vicinamibacteria bacterium]|nr:hypothetical protein [Vicinamibacteria bacterium]
MAEAPVARARLRILVLDEGDQPVAEAVVAVVRSSVPFPEIALLTDEAGAVELHVPAGVFAFRAQGPGGTSGEVEVTSPGAVESVIRLKGDLQ